jgi:hypothetical protein
MKTSTILIISLCIFSFGCTSLKKCRIKYPCISGKDSIYVQKLDTVKLILPGDSVKIVTQVPCDNFELIQENGKLTQSLKVVNGILTQRLKMKPDTIYRFTTNTVTKIKEVTKPVEVKFIPKLVKILAWIGGGFILAVIFWLGLRLKKLFI